jgi:hypothetical protein
MAEAVATRRVPGKVSGIQTIPKTRGVVSRWTEPSAWSDGSTDDWTEDAVQRYDVELWRAGAKVDDARVKGNRKFWPMTKAEAQLTGYSTKVFAVGVDGDATDADPPAGSATPEDITLGNIDGTVSKAQMGTLGISRYGTTTQMNAASAVDGDIWINTSFSPTRIYRRVAGAWVYQMHGNVLQAGTVIADAVVAGAIDGHTITGVVITAATFRTAPSGNRVEMTNTAFDRIRFWNDFNTLTPAGEIVAPAGSGTQFVVSADLGDLLLDAENGAVILNTGLGTGHGVRIGSETGTHNFLEFTDSGGTPSTPAANRGRLYWHEGNGLRFKTPAGNVVQLQTVAV